jgi:hypothetical protein
MLSSVSVVAQASLILLASGMLFAFLLGKDDALWVRTRLLPIMIGLYAFAMFVPNRWVVYAALIAIIPMMVRNRGDIPPIYLTASLALPQMPTPVSLGGMYLLDVDKWLATAIGAAIAFSMHPPRDGRNAGIRFDIPIVIFLFLEAIQARGSNATSILRSETNVFFSYLLPYFVVSRSFGRPEDLRRALIAIGFIAFVLSGIAVYESQRNVLLYNVVSQRLGIAELISSYSHQRGGKLRATASFVEATSFGAFLSTAFIAILPLRDSFRSKTYRAIGFLGVFAGIYMANTRAALLGLIVGILAYDLFRKHYRGFFRNIVLIGMVVSAALVTAQFSDQMATRLGLSGDSAANTDYRHLLLTRGWEEIKKHPVLGVSPVEAYSSLADLRQGEGIVDFVNAYIYYGLTAGIGGMIGLLLGFVLLPLKLTNVRRRIGRLPLGREIAAAIFAICIYYAIAAGTSGFGGRAAMIFYMFLAAGSALTAMRVPRAAPLAAAPDQAPSTAMVAAAP